MASFVVALGYSFNLDGSIMYCTVAVLFIAQALGAEMTVAQQIILLLMLMVMSRGIAGVPCASLVVIAATLPTFNMPAIGSGLGGGILAAIVHATPGAVILLILIRVLKRA